MLYTPPTGSTDPNASYVGKNLAAGVQGSKVPPAAVEATQREIVNVITASGQSPTGTDTQQLLKSIRGDLLSFYSDTGTADALVITPSPAYTAVLDGTEFSISKAAGANATTAPTLTVNGVTRPLVKQDGSALAAGDLNGLFTVRALGGAYRVVGLRKSDTTPTIPATALWHVGVDTSGSAATIVAAVTPAVSARLADAAYLIIPANACAGATQINVGFGAPVALVRNDGTALQAGDYAAGQPLVVIDNGTAMSIVGLTLPQVLALVVGSSSLTNIVYNLSPGGLRHVAASAGLQQQSDIGVVPNFSTVIATGSFTNASFAQCGGACALHNTTGGGYSGGTVRFALVDETSGAVVTSPYVGGGATVAGTQLPFTIPSYVFTGLTRGHTYHVAIYAQRGTGDGAQSTWDPSIYVQHDGN